MIYTKVSDIIIDFLKHFIGTPIVAKNSAGQDVPVKVVYFKQSAYDYTQANQQAEYPCINIFDYTPVLSDRWTVSGHKYSDDFIEENPDFGDKATASIYHEPARFRFRFDISIAAKSFYEYQSLRDYFNKKYLYRFPSLELVSSTNEKELVSLTVVPTDVQRVDGVLETNYEFSFEEMVYVREPETVEAITQVIIDLFKKDLDENISEPVTITINNA